MFKGEKKRTGTQILINKIRSKREEITANTKDVEMIIKDYYKQLNTNGLENLEEMDKFLEMYNLSRLNHEETEDLNTLITTKVIESIISNLPTESYSGGFYQVFKDSSFTALQTYSQRPLHVSPQSLMSFLSSCSQGLSLSSKPVLHQHLISGYNR